MGFVLYEDYSSLWLEEYRVIGLSQFLHCVMSKLRYKRVEYIFATVTFQEEILFCVNNLN